MKILLDEDVPEQVISVLQHVLRGHRVVHVTRIGWLPPSTRYPTDLRNALGSIHSHAAGTHQFEPSRVP